MLCKGNFKIDMACKERVVRMFACWYILGNASFSRRLMGSIDQADPSSFYFRIS